MISDFNRVYKRVKEVSKISNLRSKIENIALKISEEEGELSAEVLKLNGHKASKQTKEESIQNIKSEAVDVIIATLDILNFVGATKIEICDLTDKAVKKWKEKHVQRTRKKSSK